MASLRVSDNRRFLVHADGSPFFYLADTGWELFHRLDGNEAEFYLATRAAQGFNVIQAVMLAEFAGLTEPNRNGDLPLEDLDPTRPVEAYFQHVDWILERAAGHGLHIGMVVTWGDKWNNKWGRDAGEIFTPENAAIYGEWLGRRYKDAPVIWIVGGDRPIENDTHREIVTNMALGLRRGDEGQNLITFHPCGQQNSARYFHNEAWLDFNMWQTGHKRDRDNYNSIAADYALTPVKPTLDGEPGYEDHASDFNIENGFLNDYDVRRSAYWAVFAGACGHTYGCHDIWQFLSERHPPVNHARTPWREAMHLPGARQMGHLRRLIESRPYLTRIPDQSMVLEGEQNTPAHIAATRDAEGAYALIYFAAGTPATIDLSKLSGELAAASWLDPRTGESHDAGEFATAKPARFEPPTEGPGEDWVVVVDGV